MTDDLFQKQLLKAYKSGVTNDMSKKSRSFFRENAKRLVVRGRLTEQVSKDRLKSQVTLGRLYFFYYDPKTKDKLPYYDRLPLVFPFAPYRNGFLALNLHYLPPILRAKLFDALYETASNDKLNDKTKLRLSYNKLMMASKYRFFKPCLKRYLTSHVKSRFIEIEPAEWNTALMLPVADFQKAKAREVWKQSILKSV